LISGPFLPDAAPDENVAFVNVYGEEATIVSEKDVEPVRPRRFVAVTVIVLVDTACLYGTMRVHPSDEQFER
jgi:hypothetical protein